MDSCSEEENNYRYDTSNDAAIRMLSCGPLQSCSLCARGAFWTFKSLSLERNTLIQTCARHRDLLHESRRNQNCHQCDLNNLRLKTKTSETKILSR